MNLKLPLSIARCKRLILSSALLPVLLFSSCTKTTNSTVTNNSNSGPSHPAFSVNGLNDVVLVNNSGYQGVITVPLTVQYLDSAQERVSLSLSALPQGITIDTTLLTGGIPTYSTSATFYDTTAAGASAGVYPMTLTASTASGKSVKYSFDIKVVGKPTAFLGKYDSCKSSCGTTVYTDSVYVDPAMPDKIWFANFSNSGVAVYGLLVWPNSFYIPAQLVGTDTVKEPLQSSLDLTQHVLRLNSLRSGSNYCFIQMFNH